MSQLPRTPRPRLPAFRPVPVRARADGWESGKTVALARTPRPPKVSHGPTWRAICDGKWQAILRRGQYAGSYRKPEFSAISSYLAQLDRSFRETRKALRREARSQAQKARSASTRLGGGKAA